MISIDLHLGDNPNYYEPTKWSGLSAVLPVKIGNPSSELVKLVIETTEMQTLADWQAHRVTLDGFHLGFLRGDGSSVPQIHQLDLPTNLIRSGAPQKLTIEVVGRGPGLEDDFILKSLDVDGAPLSLGWI